MDKNDVEKVLLDFCVNYHKQRYGFYAESDIEWTLYNMLREKLGDTEGIFREYNRVKMNEPFFFTETFYRNHKFKDQTNIDNALTKFYNYYILKNGVNNPDAKTLNELSKLIKENSYETKHFDLAITEETQENYKLLIELKYQPSKERMKNKQIINKAPRSSVRGILKDLFILKLLKLANKENKNNVEYLFVFFDEGNLYREFSQSNFLSDNIQPDMEYISNGLRFKKIEIKAHDCKEKGWCYYCFV